MKRSNHYDTAFEELLRRLRRPYVSVNETKRALLQEASLKSMDFIVTSQHAQTLLVDVKGRRLAPRSRCWENWASEDDIRSLTQWEQVFGSGSRGTLIFAYDVTAPHAVQQHDLAWEFQGRWYAFYGIWAQDYAQAMKSCSPRWKTVDLPHSEFRRLRWPLLDVL